MRTRKISSIELRKFSKHGGIQILKVNQSWIIYIFGSCAFLNGDFEQALIDSNYESLLNSEKLLKLEELTCLAPSLAYKFEDIPASSLNNNAYELLYSNRLESNSHKSDSTQLATLSLERVRQCILIYYDVEVEKTYIWLHSKQSE